MKNIFKTRIVFIVAAVAAICIFPLKSFAASLPTLVWNVETPTSPVWINNLNGVAVDPSGNVYVVGTADISYDAIAKYDPLGNLLWSNQSGLGLDDIFNSVAVDASGNVYVGGKFDNGLTSGEIATKYDSSGAVIWSVQSGVGDDSSANGIAVDASGNVYLTGQVWSGPSNPQSTIIKYNSSGGIVWDINADPSIFDLSSIAVDASGNVYTTGWTSLYGITEKYDSSGALVWNVTSSAQNGGTNSLANTGVAVDPSGNVYAVGTYGDIVKYDNSGTALWSIKPAAARNGSALSNNNGVAVDSSGNVYVATQNFIFGLQAGLTTKYDSSGAVIWSVTSTSPTVNNLVVHGIAVDPSNNVYVAGGLYGGGLTVGFAIKYAQPVSTSSAPTSTAPISVSASCNPTSILLTQTSTCSATVSNTSNQSVTWSTNNGSITSSGIYTPSTPGTGTITAISTQDPTASTSIPVTINPVVVGAINIDSKNEVTNQPVPASWDFPVYPSVDPCTVGSCSGVASVTYSNLPLGGYTLNIIGPSNPSQFAVGSIKQIPIAMNAAPKNIDEKILSFAKDILSPSAEAFTIPTSTPLVQSLTPTSLSIGYVVLWAPIADMNIAPDPIAITGTSGGSTVNGSITVTNTGAPGSTLVWTATPNNPWITVSPSSDSTGLANGSTGNASESVAITADPSSLASGTYTGTITFSGSTLNPDGSTSSMPNQTLTVSFTVNPSGGGTSGYNCVANACVAVPSGATFPNPGGAASCGAVCGTGPSGPTSTTSTGPSGPSSCGGPSNPCGSCTFAANPMSIIIPQQSTLSYSCSSVTSCSITGGNISSPIGILANASNTLSGTTVVSPVMNSTYTLTCTGSNGGTTTNTAQVNVENSILCESNPGGTNCPHP